MANGMNVGELVFSTETKDGIQYVNLLARDPFYYISEVIDKNEDNKVHQALLVLLQKYSEKKVSVECLQFLGISITRQFLEEISNLVSWTSKSVSIYHCDIQMSQEEFEDWICPLQLESIYYEENQSETVEINDKVILSVSKKWQTYSPVKILLPKITDSLLDHWKEHPPNLASFQNSQTSFTMKAVTEFIKIASDKKWMHLDFGHIECRRDDGKYLMELQKMTKLRIKMEERYALFTDMQALSSCSFQISFEELYENSTLFICSTTLSIFPSDTYTTG